VQRAIIISLSLAALAAALLVASVAGVPGPLGYASVVASAVSALALHAGVRSWPPAGPADDDLDLA
jgi:hypothetical protein